MGETVFAWSRDALGVTINEMFGQTEINYIVGNSHTLWPAKPGSIGRPYPGHRVALIDDDGKEVPTGEIGEVAVNRTDIHGDRDAVFFLDYWKNAEATRNKFTGDWCRTGDLARRDEDGYFWYQGRADDMFKAAGYRIGPSEIENCLVKHPAVANAAVVPSPDPERGNIVKAFIVLTPGSQPSGVLEEEIRAHVRGRLAPYEYPKEIEFIEQLPMTTTGKVQRRVLRLREAERKGKEGGGAKERGNGRRYRSGPVTDEDLALGFHDEHAVLVAGFAGQHDDAAGVLRFVQLVDDLPGGLQRVPRPHRRLEAARVLKIGDRGAVKVHSDRRRHERAGERSMEDPPAEPGRARKALVDVQRVEVAEEAGGEDEMRLGDRERRVEALADRDVVVVLARKHRSSLE